MIRYAAVLFMLTCGYYTFTYDRWYGGHYYCWDWDFSSNRVYVYKDVVNSFNNNDINDSLSKT